MKRSSFSFTLVAALAAVAVAPVAWAQNRSVQESLSSLAGEYRLGAPGANVSHTAAVGDADRAAGFPVVGIVYDATVTLAAGNVAQVGGRIDLLDASGHAFASRDGVAAVAPDAEGRLHIRLYGTGLPPASAIRVTYQGLSGGEIVLRDPAITRLLHSLAAYDIDYGD